MRTIASPQHFMELQAGTGANIRNGWRGPSYMFLGYISAVLRVLSELGHAGRGIRTEKSPALRPGFSNLRDQARFIKPSIASIHLVPNANQPYS